MSNRYALWECIFGTFPFLEKLNALADNSCFIWAPRDDDCEREFQMHFNFEVALVRKQFPKWVAPAWELKKRPDARDDLDPDPIGFDCSPFELGFRHIVTLLMFEMD